MRVEIVDCGVFNAIEMVNLVNTMAQDGKPLRYVQRGRKKPKPRETHVLLARSISGDHSQLEIVIGSKYAK